MSHVVVLGADIIGITTAYFLTKAGHRLTVIERNSHAGLETSYANGGQPRPRARPSLARPPLPICFLTPTTARWDGRSHAAARKR